MAETKPKKMSTKVKHLVMPKPVRQAVHTPLLEGRSPQRGDPVTHPDREDGVIGWTEWRGLDGEWVQPLQRVEDEGHWLAIVTTERGGYRCPLSQLSRR